MVQLSIVLVGVLPEAGNRLAELPEPLVATPHPRGLRVTGVWAGEGLGALAAARGALATWLERALPAGGEVVDLFTGLPIDAALLRRPVSVQSVCSARHTVVDGRIWARLFGLYALGASDVVASAASDVPVAEVYRLLTHYARWRLESAHEGRAGAADAGERPMPYGYGLVGLADADVGDAAFWAMLRERLATEHLREAFDARMVAPAPMVLCEAEDLDLPDPERFVVGVTQTLRVRAAQLAVCERWGLPADARLEAPCAADAAGFCSRLDLVADVRDFFAYREPPKGPLDSGWRFGCLDATHRHDETTLRIAPLARLEKRFPGLAAYLALPPGWVVLREDDAFWVQPPDEARALRDTPEVAP
jgi:hypothetical protein